MLGGISSRGYKRIHHRIILVVVGRKILILQAKADGEGWKDAPGIVKVIGLRGGAELGIGEQQGGVGFAHQSKKIVGKTCAGVYRGDRVVSGLAAEDEVSANERVAQLIKPIAADFCRQNACRVCRG